MSANDYAEDSALKQTANKRLAATELVARISASLSEALTPSLAKALMALKGLEVNDLAMQALVGPAALRQWLDGNTPIMPARQLGRIELVLGFDRGVLSCDRVHVLKLDESRLGKDVCAKYLNEIAPLFKRSLMSVCCDDSGNDTWESGTHVHVIAMPHGGHAITLSHPKTRFGSAPIAALEKTIAWAEHGHHGGGRSDLVLPSSLASSLSKALPQENDVLAHALAKQFDQAAQLKASGGLMSLKHGR